MKISAVSLFRIKQTLKICKCIGNSVCRAGYEENKLGKKSEGAKDENEKYVCG